MPSDHDPSSHKPSALADVFKTLASGRRKSLSPLSTAETSPEIGSGNEIDPRRSSRTNFGFESLNRAAGSMPSSGDLGPAPDFETALRSLQFGTSSTTAGHEAENVARVLHRFTPEQSLALWEAGSYLIHDKESEEARCQGAKLLDAVAARQDYAPDAKERIWESISLPTEANVIPSRVNAMASLSNDGKRLDFTSLPVLPTLAECISPLYNAVAEARSRARKNKTPRPTGFRYDDDENLNHLLEFIATVIKLQSQPTSDDELAHLLSEICSVCKKTSVVLDIRNALTVFDAVILYAEVPEKALASLLEVLCSIYASVKQLAHPTSAVVRNLALSTRKQLMVDTLHSFLDNEPTSRGRYLNVVRGVIDVFTDLILMHGKQEGYPEVSFPALVDSLLVVATWEDARVKADILDLCMNMLDSDYSGVCIQQPDWSTFVQLLVVCAQTEVTQSPQSTAGSPAKASPSQEEAVATIVTNVGRLATALEKVWGRLSPGQQAETERFLMKVHRHLSTSHARLLLGSFMARRACFPGQDGWESLSRWLIESFLRSPEKTTEVRVAALETLKDALFERDSLEQFEKAGLITTLLEDFAEEQDPLYLEALVSVMVDIACKGDDTMLRTIVDTMSSPMAGDLVDGEGKTTAPSSRRSSASGEPESSLSNICATGLVKLFLRFLNASAERAQLIFEALIFVMKTWKKRLPDTLLTVFKLFYRLRCDSRGAVMVVTDVDNEYLVNIMSRSSDGGGRQGSTSDASGTERSSIGEDSAAQLVRPSHPTVSATPSRSMSRVSSSQLRGMKWTPPSWTLAGSQSLPEDPPLVPSPYVFAFKEPSTPEQEDESSETQERVTLKINVYLETVIDLLQRRETPWDVYSYIVAFLGAQLANRDFFSSAVPQIQMLRNVLCGQIKGETFREPPAWSGIKKADVAICIYEALTMLIGYHGHFAKSEKDELVRAFMLGIGSWDGTSQGCLHALDVCCHEMPLSVTKSLNAILDKMSKVITMANLAVHILEFLALLARLPDVYVNLREEEIRTVFGICVRFIQTTRQQRYAAEPESPNNSRGSSSTVTARLSGGLREIAAAQAESGDTAWQGGVSRYVYALTFHVMVFWFLSLKIQDRAKHVNWITSRLIFTDEHGREVIEEQSEVFIDFMQRVTYSDLGDTIPYETFPPSPEDGPVTKKSWIVGTSIVTIETAGVSGLTQITKRMASGTTYAEYRQRTAPTLPHQVPATPDIVDRGSRTAILPSHVLLQMMTTAFPTPRAMQPIPLPDDDMTRRALSTFDRNDIVDSHKVGVVFIDRNQTLEADILANTKGSRDYEHFLEGLGTKVAIRGAQFNTQGLHPDIDGEYTYAWRDRVTELVFHITTMMPTNREQDPQCINKKRHVGNDFVNIIFNRSNVPFDFDTIPSQFNSVNIVITPVSRIADDDSDTTPENDENNYDDDKEDSLTTFHNTFYLVRVMSKPGLPEISAASTRKIISGKSLAGYVRILALNASVFALVWNSREVGGAGGEHISSWRNRLREIKRLRDRVLAAQMHAAEGDANDAGVFGGGRRKAPVPASSSSSSTTTTTTTTTTATAAAAESRDYMADWTAAMNTGAVQALDFSQWTR
ncbi:hypothetical protein VTN31DRAFT_5777 [Thermomyces dupontii]|uniref:uncharacterized protein n=1 Tax=Talaromyces thermophilus TaxID=28565 RepID=UPI00374499C6